MGNKTPRLAVSCRISPCPYTRSEKIACTPPERVCKLSKLRILLRGLCGRGKTQDKGVKPPIHTMALFINRGVVSSEYYLIKPSASKHACKQKVDFRLVLAYDWLLEQGGWKKSAVTPQSKPTIDHPTELLSSLHVIKDKHSH